MTDEEKIERNKQIKEKIETDNEKMLEDLIESIEEKIRDIDLSDDYLKEHNLTTREEIGIEEYSYGISMIPCDRVYPFLLDLQTKNKTIKSQQEEIEQSNKVIDKRNEEKIELVEMCLKKDKIIDLTIAFISTRYKEDEDINNFAKEVMERGEWTNLNKILKEYFTKKVEEEQ